MCSETSKNPKDRALSGVRKSGPMQVANRRFIDPGRPQYVAGELYMAGGEKEPFPVANAIQKLRELSPQLLRPPESFSGLPAAAK
ncbi:UNVERIFIED_CONTAM: hypothetical protein K2H54_075263 [Gekko kuhli]